MYVCICICIYIHVCVVVCDVMYPCTYTPRARTHQLKFHHHHQHPTHCTRQLLHRERAVRAASLPAAQRGGAAAIDQRGSVCVYCVCECVGVLCGCVYFVWVGVVLCVYARVCIVCMLIHIYNIYTCLCPSLSLHPSLHAPAPLSLCTHHQPTTTTTPTTHTTPPSTPQTHTHTLNRAQRLPDPHAPRLPAI